MSSTFLDIRNEQHAHRVENHVDCLAFECETPESKIDIQKSCQMTVDA